MVGCSLLVLSRLWRGDESWEAALRSGRVELEGSATARRQVPSWIGQSWLAEVPRVPAAG